MDTPLSLAPVPVPAPQVSSPPWDVEAAEAPAPVRSLPHKPALPVSPPIRAERVPPGILALTVVTAVLLIFGARSANPEGARIMDFATQPLY